MPGATEKLRLHLPLAAALLAASPTQRALSSVFSSLHGAATALTCPLGSHSAALRDQTLISLRMIQTRIPNGTQHIHGVRVVRRNCLSACSFSVDRA